VRPARQIDPLSDPEKEIRAMSRRPFPGFVPVLLVCLALGLAAKRAAPTAASGADGPDRAVAAAMVHAPSVRPADGPAATNAQETAAGGEAATDYWSLIFVFMLATFIGMGVIRRVSRLLHTPLMSLTNAISAIAVVGSIFVVGADHPMPIRVMGAVALFASVTNIVSGFLITDRMLKMFKPTRAGGES
jgi:NAD(P) transhydrogenase subunit alpha